MEPYVMQYKNHIIEIFEHPIYRDFEYVIKTLDGKVLAASDHQYKMFEDAEVNAKMLVANR